MKMKKLLILTTALAGFSVAAHAEEITFSSWGGAYSKSQEEAYAKPFTAKTGIDVNMIAEANPATPLKAMVEAGNVTVDVADIETGDAIRLCDNGVLEPLDPKMLPPGADGTPAEKDFLPGAILPCAVADIVWSTVYAYNKDVFKNDPPKTIADFFNVKKFPGKRGMRKTPKINLEMALMADGVPADQVYKVLSTKAGVDRAFKKLDTIKKDIVWWEAGAQPPQLLADGEVAMTTAYNGRIFNAQVAENKPFEIVWDGQVLDYDFLAIPRGAPHMDAAKKFITFATESKQLADQAKWISYGPARKSSLPLVGKFMDGKTEMGPHMPTATDHMKNAIFTDSEFWADNQDQLNERFNAWLAKQ